MKQMQTREAKAKFAEVLHTAEQGDAVIITRHGKPVAMVVPMDKGRQVYPQVPKKTLLDHLKAFPGGLDLDLERDHRPPREIDFD